MWKSIAAIIGAVAGIAGILSLFRDLYDFKLPPTFPPLAIMWLGIGILIVAISALVISPSFQQYMTQLLSSTTTLSGFIAILALLMLALIVQAFFERSTVSGLETQITQVLATQTAQSLQSNALIEDNQLRATAIIQAQATQEAYATAVSQKEAQLQSMCSALQESNGTVFFEATKYTAMLPGREHPYAPNNPNRNATHVSWIERPDFPGGMQASPNITPTNTFTSTNGPTLIYTINFTRPDTYFVYISGFGEGATRKEPGSSDSVHVGLGGVSVTSVYSNGLSLEENVKEPHWYSMAVKEGVPISVEVPNPGVYTFFVWARENGVVIDRIWLDTRPDAVAQGASPSSIDEPNLSQCVVFQSP